MIMSSAENNNLVDLSLSHRRGSCNNEDYRYVKVTFPNTFGVYLESKFRDSRMISPNLLDNESAKKEISRISSELNELFGDDPTTIGVLELMRSDESLMEKFDNIFEGYRRYEEN